MPGTKSAFAVHFFYIVLAAFAVLPEETSAQAGKPSIHFESTSRNAGIVTSGEIIKEVFPFANKGKAMLVISNIGHS